jgi:sugar lactone lactonase YvrE
MNPSNAPTAEPVVVIDLDTLGAVGSGLVRPECVLANHHGDLYTADWRGGVAHTRPDGTQTLYTAPMVDGLTLRPNGIALLADGSFLVTQLGESDGGVYHLSRDGQIRPWLMQVDGVDLPPTNFVVQDGAGRTWITVSTRQSPRARAYRSDMADGFIVCVDALGGAAIVADGLGYTNEVALDASGEWLYANETFGRRVSRFRVSASGALGPREAFASLGEGSYPDGLAFDEAGHLWVVSIVSNRLIRIAPDGSQRIWLEDVEPQHLAWTEAAYQAGEMGRPHLDGVRSQRLRNISSIAFAGPERRTGVLGCLLGDQLITLNMPAPGLAPHHWSFA